MEKDPHATEVIVSEPTTNASRLVSRISESDWVRLVNYARYRLDRVGLERLSGEDVVQRAIEAVLLGVNTAQGGRHPRTCDLQSQEFFYRYMRGIIRSLVDAHRRTRERSSACDHVFLVLVDSSASPEVCADGNLLVEEFFVRLKSCVPPRLLRIVDAWHLTFPISDEIPLLGKPRKYRQEVRAFSKRVLSQMSLENTRSS